MSDFQQDYDEACTECGHSPIHYQNCWEPGCEDGFIDVSEENFMLEGTEMYPCEECRGTGLQKWCPKCGANLSGMSSDEDLENEEAV